MLTLNAIKLLLYNTVHRSAQAHINLEVAALSIVLPRTRLLGSVQSIQSDNIVPIAPDLGHPCP